MMLECLQGFTGNGSVITWDNTFLGSGCKADVIKLGCHVSWCWKKWSFCWFRARDENETSVDASFWLFTIQLSLLTQTQYPPLVPLFPSSLSYPSHLFLFTLHLPPACQCSFWALCFPLCCGSRSFISLSELSGARCPGTASIRDVVINGFGKGPPYFPPTVHPLHSLHYTRKAHRLCGRTTVRRLMVLAVDINLLEVRKQEKGEETHSWDTYLLFAASLSSFLACIHIWFRHHVPFAQNVSISLRLSSPLLSLTYHLSHVDFMSSPQPIRACISEIGNYIPFLCVWEQTALQIAFPAPFFLPAWSRLSFQSGCRAYNQSDVQGCIPGNVDI